MTKPNYIIDIDKLCPYLSHNVEYFFSILSRLVKKLNARIMINSQI